MSGVVKKIKSKLGAIYLVASDKGLQGVYLSDPEIISQKATPKALAILKATETQLTEYFDGKRKKFNLPFDIEGTEFQKKVWNQLSQIPYGEVCSYKDIAEKLKNSKAFRAVGTANGKNPLCIIVPCHRVIAADGSLGGYTGGLHYKVKLLALEGQVLK
jgi:methylated-DNA-[protein]-cysteine S-methyltransferase